VTLQPIFFLDVVSGGCYGTLNRNTRFPDNLPILIRNKFRNLSRALECSLRRIRLDRIHRQGRGML